MDIYFDNAATTRVCDEAAQMAMKAMTEFYGNPSSLHHKGLEIEKEIKKAREKVAKLWGVTPGEVYFTSCATEGNNMAIMGAIKKGLKWGNKVITTKAEHPAVLEVLEHCRETMGIEIIYIGLNRGGQPDIEMLERVTDEKVILLTMMHVNNETGVIMPVKEAVSVVKRKAPRAFTHSDMVQSFGKTGAFATSLGVDFATISGHKFHAPKGVGALYIKKGVAISPMFFGGGQEKNIRSGTENASGILAMGKAAEIVAQTYHETEKSLSQIKEFLINKITENIPDCFVNGENTVSNVLNMTFLGLKSEILLHSLEAEGIYVSSGSACSSNHPSPSKVLTAMGLKPREIDGSIRFSFSRYNTLNEAEKCAQVLINEVPKIRKFYRG